MKRARFIGCLVAMFLCAFVANAAVTVTNIATGEYYSLLLKSDGSFWGMGYNGDGELGDGTTNRSFAPELLVSNGVVRIVGGGGHTLFLKSDGSLWGMGYNADGELGDGTASNRYAPEQIVSSGVVAMAGGDSHTLFVKNDGSLWGMGYNGDGELGDGTTSNRFTPEQIVPSGVVAVAAGWSHSLFLKLGGSLWAMGDNAEGQLGDGSTNNQYLPEQILSTGVIAISTRYNHSLFLKTDGSLWGMGFNGVGQLGITNTVNQTNPVEIVSSNVVAIAAGENHSLFLKSNGSLWGMGRNGDGQLGLGSTVSQTNTPAQLVASNVTAIAAGLFHSLLLNTNGTLWAMGYDNDGQLGDGTGVNSVFVYTPELVNAITFTANAIAGYPPLAVQFASPGADFYANPISSWSWSFGDGSNGVVQNPLHVYQGIGLYSPALRATNNLGGRVTAVGPAILAAFNSGIVTNGGFETGNFSGWTQSGDTSFSSVVSPGQVSFPFYYIHSGNYGCRLGPPSLGYLSQTLSTTPGVSYGISCWVNFGNAGNESQFTVSWNGTNLVNYAAGSFPPNRWVNFTFDVTATSANTALQFGFQAANYLGFDDVSVFPLVAASVDVTNGPLPLTVHFTSPSHDATGHSITNRLWDFGDGSTNTTQNPAHTYTQLSVPPLPPFSPSLIALNDLGQTVVWYAPPITVSIPTLQYTASPTNAAAPFTVQFTSPSTDSGDNAITNWQWDFGDDTDTSTNQSPSHLYRVQGIFTPTLQALDSYGLAVNVSGPGLIQSSGLVNNYSFENSNPTNTSLPDGWTIGDTNGNHTAVSILQDKTHSGTNSVYFSYDGLLSQNLSTTPGAGYFVSFWIYRGNYAGQPDGYFSALWNGNTIFFQAPANAPEFVWTNIQCYVVANGPNALLQFQTTPSPYCDIYLDDVSVTPAEVELATATPSNGPINLAVRFNAPATDTAGNSMTAWDWDFGDGSPHNSSQNPLHAYTSVGMFNPVLAATNSEGAPVPSSTLFITTSLPTVQVTPDPTNGVAPLAVQFTAPATDNSGLTITNWNWSFGDTTTGAGQNPLHTYYGDSGDPSFYPPFQPALIATNSAGIPVIGIIPPITVTYNEGLVTNGGFDTGDFTGWTPAGYVNIGGSYWYSGGNSAEFGTIAGSLSQTIPTTPGAGYALSFALESLGGANGVAVWWNGAELLGQTNWSAGQNWTNFQFFVAATNANSTLQFVFTPNNGSNYVEFLDDVSLLPAEIEPLTATPVSGPIPLTVHFSAPPTDTAGNAIAFWDWNFGDGSPHSSAQNPLHPYTTVGNFVPVLTATTAGGAPVPAQSAPVITTTYPMIAFTATPTNGSNPLMVQFTSPSVDSSGQAVTNWNWNFGDGGISATQSPSHTYLGSGNFLPVLLATNSLGAPVLAVGPATIFVAFNSGIVSNGGFETGNFTGWTATAGSVASSSQYVHSGVYGAQLGPVTLQHLAQTLPTMPGASYVLSYWLENFADGGNTEFAVSWNGTTLNDQLSLPAFAWTNYQFQVTATSSNTVLQFGFLNAPSYFGLDDISVLPSAAGGPALMIGSLTGGRFQISWPANTGLELQTATNLTLPVGWQPLTNNIMTNGGAASLVVTNAPEGGNHFYRLATP